MRKILSLVMVLSLVLGSFSFAFAADVTADIEDKDVKTAVERLVAFGIVNGMDDGKYHPEMKVTREQFAKLVVEALGLGSAAEAAKGSTQFTDVNADRWSSGYINTAVGQGVIKGMGDGTFAPGSEVTYAQAVTMLVRALGYKDEFLSGSWPGNYVAKAAELDITDDVKFSPSGTADRGAVAVMVDNTLDAETIVQESYGDDNNWKESGKTLLTEKLDITEVEEIRITEVAKINDNLKENEIKINEAVNNETELEVAEGVNTTNLLGKEVTLFVNDDDEVVYLEVTTNDSDIVVGSIDKVYTDSDKIRVRKTDASKEDKIKLADKAKVYVDNKEDSSALEDVSDSDKGLYGTFILDDNGDIAFADLYKFETKGLIVKEINTDKKYVKGLIGTRENKKADFDSEDGYKLFLDGEEIKIEDLKNDDVIYTANVEHAGDDYIYGFVVRKAEEGIIKTARVDEINLDGKDYDVNELFNKLTYSLDKDDEVKEYNETPDNLKDPIKEKVEVKLIFDIMGKVRHITTDVNETSDDLYGIVTKTNFTINGGDDAVRIFTREDESSSYSFDESKDADKAKKEMIVKYRLDNDGEIEDGEFEEITKSAVSLKKFDDDSDYIMDTDGKKYYVTNKTVIMNKLDSDGDFDPDLIKWDTIKDADESDVQELKAVIYTDDNNTNAEFVVFTNDYDLGSSAELAYVKSANSYSSDGFEAKFVSLEDGTEKTVEVDKQNDVEEGTFIAYKTNTDDEVEGKKVKVLVEDDTYNKDTVYGDYEVKAGKVKKYSDDVIELYDTNETYKVLNKTTIFELQLDDDNDYDDIVDGDIDDNDTVRIILDDEDVVSVVVLGGDYEPSDDDDKDVKSVKDVADVKVKVDISEADLEDALPEQVTVVLNDDTETQKDVTWDLDDVKRDTEGTYTAKGDVKDTDKDAEVKIIVEDEVVNPNEDAIKDGSAKVASMFTIITGKYASEVTEVKIEFDGKTKVATLNNGDFDYTVVDKLAVDTEVTIKGYKGSELLDTDEIKVK